MRSLSACNPQSVVPGDVAAHAAGERSIGNGRNGDLQSHRPARRHDMQLQPAASDVHREWRSENVSLDQRQFNGIRRDALEPGEWYPALPLLAPLPLENQQGGRRIPSFLCVLLLSIVSLGCVLGCGSSSNVQPPQETGREGDPGQRDQGVYHQNNSSCSERPIGSAQVRQIIAAPDSFVA